MRGIRAVCAISVVALASCSSPAEPQTLDPLPAVTDSPADPAPSTTREPTASPLATSSLTAADFVDEYVGLTNLALSEPPMMAEWEQLFAPSCSVCASGFETATGIQARGHTISGGEWINWEVTVADQQENEALVVVSGSIDEATVSSAGGEVVDTFAAVDDVSVAYTVRRQPDGAWLIVGGDTIP